MARSDLRKVCQISKATVWSQELKIASLTGLKHNCLKRSSPVVNFARVDRFRLEVGFGVARLPWGAFASDGVSESEEESMAASSNPSSALSCSSQFFARGSDMIDFP